MRFHLFHLSFSKNKQKINKIQSVVRRLLFSVSVVVSFELCSSNSIDYVFLRLNIYVKYIFQYVSIFINKIGICSIVNLLGKFYLDVAGSCFCVCMCVCLACEIRNCLKSVQFQFNNRKMLNEIHCVFKHKHIS